VGEVRVLTRIDGESVFVYMVLCSKHLRVWLGGPLADQSMGMTWFSRIKWRQRIVDQRASDCCVRPYVGYTGPAQERTE
jgi:hypothetical protein